MSQTALLLKALEIMTQELDAIEKHLGVRLEDGQLNHYSLLGLDPNASPTEIRQALRTTVAAWNNSDTKSDPSSAQMVAKLIKQAQGVLLDEPQKIAYDLKLKWRISTGVESLFPDADPHAAFNPSEYLVGAGAIHSAPSFGSASDRWSELERRIPALLTSEFSHSELLEAVQDEPESHLEMHSAPMGGDSAARIDRLKRKRKLKQAMVLASFIAIAACFLGYAGIRFVWNRLQLAQRVESDARDQFEKSNLSNSQEKVMKSIGGNHAPKVSGNSTNFVLPTLSKQDTPETLPVDFTESNPFGGPPLVAMNPEQAKPLVPAATANSQASWTVAMKSARAAVDKADFKAFHTQIELALAIPMNDEMTAKHARLDQLGQLYEIFIKAVHDAKSKMRGTETLSVGKTLINIVEVKDEELIVRMQGKNEHYPWDRLPPGIASAMADFSLSDQEPTDIAARAVYFSLSPARNELFSKKVREWFEKAVGKGSVRKDLVQALTDTYE